MKDLTNTTPEMEQNPVVTPEAEVPVQKVEEPTAAPARVDMKGKYAAVNVRSRPNANGDILGTLPDGAIVAVVAKQSTKDYYKIEHADGLTGYILREFIVK